MHAPIGRRHTKRGEEAPSSVDTGVGSGIKTGRKRVLIVDVDESRVCVDEAGYEAESEREGLRIVLAA